MILTLPIDTKSLYFNIKMITNLGIRLRWQRRYCSMDVIIKN